MSDAAVLFVKPKAISAKDKRALQGVGIVVVEVEDPQAVKFVRAATELPYGDILAAAGKAIDGNSHTSRVFGELVAKIMQRPRP